MIIVLEAYQAREVYGPGDEQRIIYDSRKDRIIHQFRHNHKGPWREDKVSFEITNVEYLDMYLPHLEDVTVFE